MNIFRKANVVFWVVCAMWLSPVPVVSAGITFSSSRLVPITCWPTFGRIQSEGFTLNIPDNEARVTVKELWIQPSPDQISKIHYTIALSRSGKLVLSASIQQLNGSVEEITAEGNSLSGVELRSQVSEIFEQRMMCREQQGSWLDEFRG